MSIPHTGLPKTARVSPRVAVSEHTGSTNADLAIVAADVDGWPHLSVLVTDDQRSGRGRLDREWVAPAGASIACSIMVRLPELPMHARGWVPLAAGLAVRNAVSAQLSSEDVAVKWPNDVLVGGKKIAGILAEATLERDAIIVGFGINTAMTLEQLPVETATSFAAVGEAADIDRLLAAVVAEFDSLTARLVAAGGDAVVSGVLREVSDACATIDSAVRVHLPDGTSLVGAATAIDADGRLLVRSLDGTETAVSAGDVVHVRGEAV